MPYLFLRHLATIPFQPTEKGSAQFCLCTEPVIGRRHFCRLRKEVKRRCVPATNQRPAMLICRAIHAQPFRWPPCIIVSPPPTNDQPAPRTLQAGSRKNSIPFIGLKCFKVDIRLYLYMLSEPSDDNAVRSRSIEFYFSLCFQ